jgi:hypothetical protein
MFYQPSLCSCSSNQGHRLPSFPCTFDDFLAQPRGNRRTDVALRAGGCGCLARDALRILLPSVDLASKRPEYSEGLHLFGARVRESMGRPGDWGPTFRVALGAMSDVNGIFRVREQYWLWKMACREYSRLHRYYDTQVRIDDGP